MKSQKSILALTLAAFALSIRPGAAKTLIPDIRHFTSAPIRTLQFQSQVVSENRPELQKIGGDFANAYRVHNVTIEYAQPGKLHMETTVLSTQIGYTINGDKRYTSVPRYHIHKIEDIGGAPGKKQSLLDSGLVPPEQLIDYNAVFLRKDRTQYVFQLMPKLSSETFKDIVWIDPKTHITTRRQHYDRDGKLVASYVYANPVAAAPGIYIPSRIEVYNAENRLAGVTAYRNIRVNGPLDMSVFEF